MWFKYGLKVHKRVCHKSTARKSVRRYGPQERLADLRISLTPSGLANQYYGLIPQHLLPCLGRVAHI